MSVKDLLETNPLLIDRVRLAIIATLSTREDPMDFTSLLSTLELTKGNLSSHMRKLEEAGLIEVKKEFIGRKPKTTYCCSKKGKKEFQNYLQTISTLVKNNN